MGISNQLRITPACRSRNYELRICIVLVLLYLLQPFATLYSQSVKIGVALPLFEDSDDPAKKQLGYEIEDGIRFAVGDYNKTNAFQVKLDIEDTKRDAALCSSIIKDFGDDSSVVCVLGPVFSTDLGQVAELGELYTLPIISPTATGDDLASSHNYIFQLNPSYEIRGKLMADYLFKQHAKSNIVVISEESYGMNFSKPFESEMKRLGGKILLSDTYNKSAQNINDIVADILKVIKENDLFINVANLNLVQRKKLEEANIRVSFIDSLISLKTDVSIYYLFGKNAKKVMDTLSIKPYLLSNENSKFIQGYIDAIYIPISNPAEISLLVPELFSNGLTFFLAGTGDWNNEKQLSDNKIYLKNLYFESEYYLDENSEKLITLRAKLDKTKLKLTKNFLFGYDAASLILNIIGKGSRTRQQINDALNSTKEYEAIKSKISLDYHGINSELNILMYDNGIKRIDTYKLKKQP
jgi:ABC-type branched-subunit amino acid transport system substrate-binding protein